jgi:hypothetical protein
MSQRRSAVTREQGRRRLRVLMIGLAGSVLLVGIYLLLHTSLFAARAVTVVGASHETVADVVTASGLSSHPPLLDVNAGAVAAAVERMPWVAHATVQVHWPDGVRIVVQEAAPRLDMAVAGGKVAVLAASGRVLEVVAPSAVPSGLLAFAGPVAPGAAGSNLGARDAMGLAVASTLPPSFVAQVTGITVEPAGWVQLGLTTPILVDIGNASQLSAKYEDVSALLAGGTLHSGDVIDVSVPGAPTVTGP